MKALVIYESMFGNTEYIARAIAGGLARYADVEVHDVRSVPHAATDEVPLIVAGGPTHAFSMSRPATRDDAARQGAQLGDHAVGLREWLAELHPARHGAQVATFDTRVGKMRHLPGSAAKSASRAVRGLGYGAADKPHSFYVSETPGPLLAGELERACEWGAALGSELHHRSLV